MSISSSQLLFKFCIILHCHDTELPCKFSAINFLLWTKGCYQRILSSTLVKNCQIPYVIFQNTSHLIFKFCITIQCHERWLPCTYLAQTLYTLVKKSLLKCKSLRLSSARLKISLVPHITFEMTSQFFFKFFIIHQFQYKKSL